MNQALQELKRRLIEINDLNAANAILYWEQSTYMPSGGATARARQQATLGRLAHEKLTDIAIGKLLDQLEAETQHLPYESDEASLIRVTRRQYERASKIPAQLLADYYAHSAKSYHVWTQARPNNDFGLVKPYLEKTLDYSRQIANCFPGYEHIADPLINYYDEGMTVALIRPLFAELRQQLVPLVDAITTHPTADNSCLHQNYEIGAQLGFGESIIKKYGYDFERGRQDLSPHPFATTFSINDVRITTRVKENNLAEALFSSLHESGHAMYEQGINQELEGTLLASGTSAGIHESQSRLWENLVGRSKGFWEYFYPELQTTFPRQLKHISLEQFYRAINKVERTLIRTDADEVTYNLHVMIRFELELEMLEGRLAIKDLPEAWNERYQSDLGVQSPNDSNGILQDVHWYSGWIGGNFQGYTLGNIMSALFYEHAVIAHPEIPAQIKEGQYNTLRTWLTDKIYHHGRKFTANELLERITGARLTIDPYIGYLRNKYGELYEL